MSERYHDNLLVMAIEFKKIFMDEWTGEIFQPILTELSGKFSGIVKDTLADFQRLTDGGS